MARLLGTYAYWSSFAFPSSAVDTHIKIVLNPVPNLVRKATCQVDSAVAGCCVQQTRPRLGSWRIKKSALSAQPGVQPAGADGLDASRTQQCSLSSPHRQGQCQSLGKTDLIITIRMNGMKLSVCAPIVTTFWSHQAPMWHLLKNVAVNIACL